MTVSLSSKNWQLRQLVKLDQSQPAFALVGRIDLLTQLSPRRLMAAGDAWNEWLTGVRIGRLPSNDLPWLPVNRLDESEQNRRDGFMLPLDLGEAACLALTLSLGYALMTDDLIARREARRLGVPLSGTIGALISLMDDQILTPAEANRILSDR